MIIDNVYSARLFLENIEYGSIFETSINGHVTVYQVTYKFMIGDPGIIGAVLTTNHPSKRIGDLEYMTDAYGLSIGLSLEIIEK